MDFGKILDIWDKKQEKKTSQKIHPPQEERKNPAGQPVNPINAWLRINGIHDKDREEDNHISPGERRRRLLAKHPDAELDLHGLTVEEAWSSLENFFNQSYRRGFTKVLLIHGKGNHSDGEGVLRGLVKRFIENCPFAGESGHGAAKVGGTGSTWVVIKNPAAKKELRSEIS